MLEKNKITEPIESGSKCHKNQNSNLQKLTQSTAGKVGVCLATLLATEGRADAHTPETDPNRIATRVYVNSNNHTDLVSAGAGVETPLAMDRDQNLAVVWMSKKFGCNNGNPSNPNGAFRAPVNARLSCHTESDPGVMQGVTSVTATVPAPVQNETYRFNADGCNDCARDISVTVNSPVLTEETGYNRYQVDERIKETGDQGTCCDLTAGLLVQPDISKSTAGAGVGGNLMFQGRPHDNFGLGMQYSYSVADVWLNPALQRDIWTDNTHPEHLHQIHARGVFTAPLIRGDHDWLRLEAGALLGTSIWQYENMAYDQYTGRTGSEAYSWQVQSAQNQTRMTFDVGGTAGLSFYPHRNIVLQLGADALVNVNGHDRIRTSNRLERVNPENTGHDLRLGLKGNLGVSF